MLTVRIEAAFGVVVINQQFGVFLLGSQVLLRQIVGRNLSVQVGLFYGNIAVETSKDRPVETDANQADLEPGQIRSKNVELFALGLAGKPSVTRNFRRPTGPLLLPFPL